MSKKETSGTLLLRKRFKRKWNEREEELEYKDDENIPRDKKVKLTKILKKGDTSSYSADSKEILTGDSFEKAIKLFEKKDPALSDFIKTCLDENNLMDVEISAYQTIVKMIISV